MFRLTLSAWLAYQGSDKSLNEYKELQLFKIVLTKKLRNQENFMEIINSLNYIMRILFNSLRP